MLNNNGLVEKAAREKFRIKVTVNGPYIVTGGVPLREMSIVSDAEGIAITWQPGKEYPLRETYTLCRCRQSRNKPFCDFTHRRINFRGDETADRRAYRELARVYRGPGLDLTDARLFCVHARFCDRAGGIWELTKKSGETGARQIVIEEARDCPSGRLTIREKSGREIEPELAPSIALVEHLFHGVAGPIWVRGGIPIEAADGTTYEIRNRVTLCRCGKSANAPFCDGSHLP